MGNLMNSQQSSQVFGKLCQKAHLHEDKDASSFKNSHRFILILSCRVSQNSQNSFHVLPFSSQSFHWILQAISTMPNNLPFFLSWTHSYCYSYSLPGSISKGSVQNEYNIKTWSSLQTVIGQSPPSLEYYPQSNLTMH